MNNRTKKYEPMVFNWPENSVRSVKVYDYDRNVQKGYLRVKPIESDIDSDLQTWDTRHIDDEEIVSNPSREVRDPRQIWEER